MRCHRPPIGLCAAALTLMLLGIAPEALAQIGRHAGGEEAMRHYLYGRWRELDGDLQGAAEEYFRALSLDPESVDLLVSLSALQGRTGEPERSLELADRALARDSSNAQALWLRGAALFNLHRAAEALQPLLGAARHDSTDTRIVRTLAHVAEVTERLDLIHWSYSRLVELDEQDGESWFQLATAQARLGRFGKADTSLVHSLDLQPARPGARFLAGWIRENRGMLDSAAVDYQQHLKSYPQDDASRQRLVVVLSRLGRFRQAWPEAERLARARPREQDVLMLAAECAYAAGHAGDGAQLLADLRDLDPADPDLVERSLLVLTRQNRAAEAVRLADAWAAAHVADLSGRMLTARVRAITRDLPGATLKAREAVEFAPDSIAPRRLLARILEDQERWQEAGREWLALLEIAPGDPLARLQRAHCLDKLDLPDSAAAEARAVLEHEPKSAQALNFIGYLWADRNRHLDEARSALARAIALDPDNGAYVDSWGWLLFRLGEYDEARTQLERALVLTGGDPVIHEHLGDVYLALRDAVRARIQYRMCLDLDRDNRRVQAKLEGLH